MKQKITAAYLKGVFGISFFVLEILRFCVVQMRKVMTSQVAPLDRE